VRLLLPAKQNGGFDNCGIGEGPACEVELHEGSL
jgi:hypothetical protein